MFNKIVRMMGLCQSSIIFAKANASVASCTICFSNNPTRLQCLRYKMITAFAWVCKCVRAYESEREITYFQPRIWPQQQQNISATVCIPESIILSSWVPTVTFTLNHPKKTEVKTQLLASHSKQLNCKNRNGTFLHQLPIFSVKKVSALYEISTNSIATTIT